MNNLLIKKIDCASEYIIRLKFIMRKLASKLCVEPGLLQQLLDNESLYIKQIPRDSANPFRVIADTVNFSQAEFPSLMLAYTGMLKANLGVFIWFE